MERLLLNDFQEWLNRRYSMNSVRRILGDTIIFINWCKEENINPEKTAYKELLDFVAHCTANGNAKRTVNQKMTSLKLFFHYLIAINKRTENPATEIRIRNQSQTVPADLIKYEELEMLYKDYPARGIAGKRNKSVIGLLVYQGLNAAELQALEVKDLKLAEGKIYIPGTGRSNDRTLKLEAQQMVQLQNYVLQIRPILIAVNEKETDKLFTSYGNGSRLSNSFVRMLNTIRTLNPKVKDLRQIRASVIAQWYKLYNTRQVQYMAGHRYVSSTERYRTDKLESLQEQLEKIHPLG